MYNREKAVDYAVKWALKRNPDFYDFEELGGDCTNFVSQCLYAGCGVMNYKKEYGWYYIDLNNRSASWSGVEYLYNFLISNEGDGPYGEELPLQLAEKGDIIQLSFDGIQFSHAVIITKILLFPSKDNIFIACHTYDSLNRRLSTYSYKKARLIHITGSR